jgi:hypothetical protein
MVTNIKRSINLNIDVLCTLRLPRNVLLFSVLSLIKFGSFDIDESFGDPPIIIDTI